MSMRDLILDAVARRMLFPIVPRQGARRALFVHERLWEVLQSPEGDDEWEQRVAELQADLEVFADGTRIGPKYLFHLYPARDSIWEIRSIQNVPTIRVLGLFAERDVFIATNHALREELGGWESREWKRIKREAGARWRHIFNTYEPLRGTDVHQNVSDAINGKYFK